MMWNNGDGELKGMGCEADGMGWTFEGSIYGTGCLPYDGPPLMSSGALPDIPESQWVEFDLRDDPYYNIPIIDQKNTNSCTGHAAASSLEGARYVAGLEYLPLSPFYCYAGINNGVDRGSSVNHALSFLRSHGTCISTLVPWGTIKMSAIGEQAHTNALLHRIEIGERLLNFRDLCIACQLRRPFVFTVPVNSNFNTLDDEGCPRNQPGQHNHAVSGGFAMRRKKNGQWKIGLRNSWGTRWGLGGYCWADINTIRGTYFDSYSVKAVVHGKPYLPPAAA